jgi:hypothetical protein
MVASFNIALIVAAKLPVRPEWQLPLENQAEWCRFAVLSATPQRNDTLTIQLIYRSQSRTRP